VFQVWECERAGVTTLTAKIAIGRMGMPTQGKDEARCDGAAHPSFAGSLGKVVRYLADNRRYTFRE